MTTTIRQDVAMQWLNDEAQRYTDRERADPTQAPTKMLLSPASWVLPKLLRIVYQNTDQPVEALAPLIRSMLQEQVFATTGGDPCACEQLDASINDSVAMLTRVLHKVREHCRAQVPASPVAEATR